jgi:hypothetical protein
LNPQEKGAEASRHTPPLGSKIMKCAAWKSSRNSIEKAYSRMKSSRSRLTNYSGGNLGHLPSPWIPWLVLELTLSRLSHLAPAAWLRLSAPAFDVASVLTE